MTFEEYAHNTGGAVMQSETEEPTVFSGKPRVPPPPRQTCECSKCGRVAIVICGTCDEVKP